LKLLHGDGRLGVAASGPFDSIISAAGGDDLPSAWLEQLAVGGRLVAPCRALSGVQTLLIVDRTSQGLVRTQGEQVQFVPLKSGIDAD
jgi:protein-L-isoaspartate(D-aspartate) O-methyltransferase